MQKKKILIDGLAYVSGRAPGFNNYFVNVLESVFQVLGDSCEFTVVIRKDQLQHFQWMLGRAKTICFECRGVFERVLKESFLLPFVARNYDLTIFPANISPLFFPHKHILAICDLNFLSFPDNFSCAQLFLRGIFQKMCLRRANACVAISEVVREEVRSYSAITPFVIYVPIKVGRSARCTSVSSAAKNIIVIPSSLAVHKNVTAAYEASLDIVAVRSNVEFVFFGGWGKSEFPIKSCHPSVRILGRISDEERDKIYRDCTAMLVPSTYEGFGMPYAEAMIAGIPLLCCDIPIANEIVANYASYISRPYGALEIRNALLAMIDSNFPVGIVNSELLNRYSFESIGSKYGFVIDHVLREE